MVLVGLAEVSEGTGQALLIGAAVVFAGPRSETMRWPNAIKSRSIVMVGMMGFCRGLICLAEFIAVELGKTNGKRGGQWIEIPKSIDHAWQPESL